MSDLVIVESPTKAKTIQKFLGDKYKIMASYGHIRDLKDKELSVDVDNGFKPDYVIPADKKKVVSELKAAAKEAPVIWLASDEDREGEAISWHLRDVLKLDPAKTRRIAFHEITKNAVEQAMANPRDIDENLVNAQQARRVLDRLVGFKLSPVLWHRIKRGLSAGRVQSVALRLVVDREREIAAFKSEPYYRIEAEFLSGDAALKAVLDKRFDSEAEARAFLEYCKGATFKVESIESKPGSRSPFPPFTTSTLQQEAGRRLHFSVSQTMRLAQSLYERGLITYMRTDSTTLSSLALNTAKAYIAENFGEQYVHIHQVKTKSKGAQEAHEAIRPTFIANTEIEGSEPEKKLYNLIWKRTLASQMADARTNMTSVRIGISGKDDKFVSQASEIVFDGFLKLYSAQMEDGEMETGGTAVRSLSEGMELEAGAILAECKFTQPPLRYSEPSLVKKLEELGIGRPSTYASIIGNLTKTRGYIVKGDKAGITREVSNLRLESGRISEISKTETVGAEKGKLLPQDIGIIVSDYLVENFADIMDYDFTAREEQLFDDIAAGNSTWEKAIADFYSIFSTQLDKVIKSRTYTRVERSLGKDSEGNEVVAKYGQYGPFVQKGEGENRICASLGRDQLIENITLEEALELFKLPRRLGQYEGVDVEISKGRFGPYIKYGEKNVSLPRGIDPLSVTLEKCSELIAAASVKPVASVLKDFPSGIQLINGQYGPYIKFDGSNYRLPKGTDAASLDEDACRSIIEKGKPTVRRFIRTAKKK